MATVKGKYNYISEILKGTESDDTFMAGSGNEYAFGDYGVDTGLFPYGNNLILSANYYVGFGVAVILVQGKINPIDVYYLDGIEILQTLDVSLDLNKIDRLVCKEYGLPYNFIQTLPSSAIEGPWNEDLVYSDRFFNTFFPLGDDITIFGKTDAINRIYINYSSKNILINQRDLSTTDIYSVLNGELLQHVNGKNLNSIITTDALYWRLPTSSTWEKWGAQEGFNLMKFDLLNNLLFSVTPSATTINEIGTLTTTIETINVASGTTLYYSLSGTGINTSDFSSGSLTGSGTVGSDGSFSFSHTLANDQTTEGTETLSIKLFSDSNRFIKVGETNVSIIDYVGGSTDYSYSLSKLSGLTSPNSLIGAFENYQFYNLGGNRQGIQKKGTGAIDEITGISTLTFSDTRISVLDGITGVFNQVTGKETKDAQMFRLYNASFNRFPDSNGLKYWINEYSKGITDYRNIAESFIISNEFKQRYGATNTNLEFATNMYKNILGRLPDSDGLNYWVSNLNAGTNSRVDVLGGFSESVENKNLFSQVTGFV